MDMIHYRVILQKKEWMLIWLKN